MTAARYPRRAIALGPPFDDGTYWTPDGKRHELAELELADIAKAADALDAVRKRANLPYTPKPRETGAEFVARITAENAAAVRPIRDRMDQLDSKGHRIGYRALNGGRRRVER